LCRAASGSISPRAIDEQTREHYAGLYARPRARHDAFEQFAVFNQDAIDNKALADDLRFVASDVTGGIVGYGRVADEAGQHRRHSAQVMSHG
jgi:hypothetical protein